MTNLGGKPTKGIPMAIASTLPNLSGNTLNELSALSNELNEKSNQLNSIISTINEKLGKLHLGFEMWLDSPIVAGDYHDEFDDEGRRVDRFRDVVLFGYAKAEDHWQLAVKGARVQIETDNSGFEYEETANTTQPAPLVKASREVRIESMSFIAALLDALKKRSKKVLKDIESAEKVAQKL